MLVRSEVVTSRTSAKWQVVGQTELGGELLLSPEAPGCLPDTSQWTESSWSRAWLSAILAPVSA